ncbi:hypothetical protein BD410DRAFT_762665 [Rickenella mellea]|uniref:Uncharacterized protein n=1 Tax=Rickenella mellea TaxID=50990 RepID=A0A4Y7QKZ3_9AGAM|nr:hypothetical protein BD410DRAFT_762665 [Rickenella mellea]
MNRFRKKSDAKRTQVPASLTAHPALAPVGGLLELPSVDDFRTSLILPDLSRRFSLLRKSTGEPISLHDMRSRFAEQRVKGAGNTISEEEEEMLFDALNRMRSGGSVQKSGGGNDSSETQVPSSAPHSVSNFEQNEARQSTMSSTTSSSGVGVLSPSPSFTKRRSNNFFGSSHHRDQGYIRQASLPRSGSNRSVLSGTPSEMTTLTSAYTYSDSIRPATPEDSSTTTSVASSPNDKVSGIRSAPLNAPKPFETLTGTVTELRFAKPLTKAQLQRMSVTLEEVIREIEEDSADDKVLLPRSHPHSDVGDPLPNEDHALPQVSFEASNLEIGTNWLAEDNMTAAAPAPSVTSADSPYRAASPVPRIPGYIPGMPRPMTPREADLDDQRANSTTPRATSPMTSHDHPLSPLLANSMLRRGSNASASYPTPTSPITSQFTSMADSGRYTPDRPRNGDLFELGQPQDSSLVGQRRPSSPLTGTAFQNMHNSSRPSTPSNVTWNVPPKSSNQKPKHGRNGSFVAHHRAGSSVSITDSSDTQQGGNVDRSKTITRSVRSPFRATSPAIDGGQSNVDPDQLNVALDTSNDSPSMIPRLELGSPFGTSNNNVRSPTPTHPSSRSYHSPSSSDNDPLRSRLGSPLTTPSSSPFPPRLQSPLIYSAGSNSSNSSLVSAGSSYHSWDEEHPNGIHTFGLLGHMDRKTPAWHDVSTPGQASMGRTTLTSHLTDESENILRQNAGLTKTDLALIQGRLLEAAQDKAKTPEPRALRRRRPSNAHSIQSIGGRDSRTTSPAPQSPTTTSFSRAADHTAKANALLNSVVDSIQEPPPVDIAPVAVVVPLDGENGGLDVEESSPSRRNKDLADAIFGHSTDETTQFHSDNQPTDDNLSPLPSDNEAAPQGLAVTESMQGEVPAADASPNVEQVEAPTKSPQIDQLLLMKQVQERADAAMAQLRRSPMTNSPNGSIQRKRVNPHDISSPRLFQSSTSVDKLPSVPTPTPPPITVSPPANEQTHSTSKITSRIKKLTGTLRVKNRTPNGDEVTPWTLDPTSPTVGRQGSQKMTSQTVVNPPASASTASLSRFRSSEPPASAGPSLKSFMSRFRRRGQVSESDIHRQTISPPPVRSPVIQSATLGSDRKYYTPPHSAPAVNGLTFSRAQAQSGGYQSSSTLTPPRTMSAISSPTSSSLPGTAVIHDTEPSQVTPVSPDTIAEPDTVPELDVVRETEADIAASRGSGAASPADQAALKQLFDAAENLGLDQDALGALLARSTSAGSRAGWTPGVTRNISQSMSTSNVDRARSPTADRLTSRTPEMIRKGSMRSPADYGQTRRPRDIPEGQADPGNSVVRRTLIFPSGNGSTTDLTTLLRKASKSRRRASATSVSTRSVQDRVPTPPPPTRAKRFSADSSPPVPRLPSSFPASSQSSNFLSPSGTGEAGFEKSNSTYDSLYEMYVGDRTGGSQGGDYAERNSSVENVANGEGQAVEVIEMANGETIWSIVNGLRGDDSESVYQNRISVASEFSVSPQESEGDHQLFFKEHVRNTSKGSNTSFLSRKKTLNAGLNRPETKVFYSSSTQISRLIETLSRGVDAGSFNIKPKAAPGHSHSSSVNSETDMNWTVEERLEHMLGSMGAA